MHQVSLAERAQRRLHHADVTLHAAQQKRVAITRQPLQHGAEHIAAKAGEQLLVDGFGLRKQGRNLGNRSTESFRVLRADQRRNLQNARRPNQEP